MYLKNIQLKNFKGFLGESAVIEFNGPDGKTSGAD